MKRFWAFSCAALASLALSPSQALATDGYFLPGYGLKAEGMGGAATAVADDAMGGANNPASMVWAGSLLNMSVDEFNPTRSASRAGNANGLNALVASQQNSFLLPGIGYNRSLKGGRLSVGLTVYGNGGLNTDYPAGQLNCGAGPGTGNLLCGPGQLGVNLVQLIVAPTVAFKVGAGTSLGISPLFAHQEFRAGGLQAFTRASLALASVTDNGSSTANGLGFRLGIFAKLLTAVNLGASYSPRLNMSSFAAYSGLFANSGRFDIPANYTIGAQFNPNGQLSFAADYERISYGAVPAIANASTNQAPLGSAGAPGFGWRSISVKRLGITYRASERTVLRTGFNHGDNPIQPRDVTFNIIAPGIVQNHITFGLTQNISRRGEVTFAYVRGLPNSVSGATSPLFQGAGTDTISLAESSYGLGYLVRL